ncbi:CHAT domain-containing protein [Pisolithus marmoratus]|nr:CHAT domain-containing protein [Pisolithus marmoratus]
MATDSQPSEGGSYDPVEIARGKVQALSPEDPGYLSALHVFTDTLYDLFQRTASLSDLDEFIKYSEVLLSLSPQDHPIHLTTLGNVGLALRKRVTLGGNLEDLGKAVGYLSTMMDRCDPHSAYSVPSATNLGSTLALRYRLTSDVTDLTRAIETYSSALENKFELFGDRADLETALAYFRVCLGLRPPGHPRRSSLLTSLGDALLLRSTLEENLADLEEAITCYTDALQSCTAGQSGYVNLLTSLGFALCSSFEMQGDAEQVEKAVACYRTALAASSGAGSEHTRLLYCFGNALQLRHQNTGDIEDLNFSIQLLSTSLELQPTSSTERPVTLFHLGNSLLMRFNVVGDLTDLNASVDGLDMSLQLCGKMHQFRPFILSAHSDAVLARFKENGDVADLELAITQSKAASLGCPTPYSYPALLHLNDALLARFERFKDISDLHTVISQCDNVLNTLSPTHSLFVRFRVNRAFAFLEKFQYEGNPADLDVAISSLRDVEDCLPEGDGLFVSVHLHLAIAHQGTMLCKRYEEARVLADLKQSVQHFESAFATIPSVHPERAALLVNFALALRRLAKAEDDVRHLERAIQHLQDAISLGPSDPYIPFTTAQLVDAQRRLAMRQHDNDQLQASLQAFKSLSHLIPAGHPALNMVYVSSASLLLHMFSLKEDPLLLDEAFMCFANATIHSFNHDLANSLKWAKQAERLHHSSELEAYRASLSSLNVFMQATPAVSSRHKLLLQGKRAKYIALLPSKAATCAIEHSSLEVAVELSEQGRGLIWNQLARIRTPLDALRHSGEDGMALASDFERVSAQLQRWSSRSVSEMRAQASRLTAEEDTRLYGQRRREWQEIIGRVRGKEGFESFVRDMTYHELQEAAIGGPVILLNAHEKRCDAIVVTKDRPLLLIPLQSTSVTELAVMGEKFYKALKETRYAEEAKVRERRLVPVLRKLWDVVVEPVVTELRKFLPRGSRIWILSDFQVHYPTTPCSWSLPLSALNRSRSQKPHLESAPLSSFLAIGQSNSVYGSEESELQSVNAELALVESLIPSSLSFKRISGNEGTADTAIEGLRTHDWVHLACHGNQDLVDPFASAFSLRDRPVSLLDIIRAEPENPAFAFLSACHTAVGDEHTPDEVIHLAAGMQFSGFRSVIGTMWAVDDSTVQYMVKEFYKHMFSGDKAPDCTQAAKALNKASKTVDMDAVPIDQRIVFIHIGV